MTEETDSIEPEHEIPDPAEVGREPFEARPVIAIDPSLTGTAVATGYGSAPDIERITSKPCGQPPRERLRRYANIVRRVGDICQPYAKEDPLILIEGYSYGSRGVGIYLGEFGAMLRQRLLDFGEMFEVPPKSLKKFTTDNGNADKRRMATQALKRWGVEFDTDDEVDAFSLYQMGRLSLSGAEVKAPEFQWAAIEAASIPMPNWYPA